MRSYRIVGSSAGADAPTSAPVRLSLGRTKRYVDPVKIGMGDNPEGIEHSERLGYDDPDARASSSSSRG